MGLREKINNIKPVYAYSIAGALILLAGLYLYFQFFRSSVSGLSDKQVLMCSESGCDGVSEVSHEYIMNNFTVDPTSRKSPGLKCPKCGQNSLAFAYRCPNDGTVFLAKGNPPPGRPIGNEEERAAHKGGPVCPQCGWDPITAKIQAAQADH